MSENRPAKVPTSQLIFPNAENTTSNQLANLLQIGAFALHALLRPSNNQSSVPGAESSPFPKEAEIAAENTFTKVLEVLDSVLDDKERWSLNTQKALQKKFDDAHALNTKYLEEQAEFAHTMNLPHFRFKPALLRLRDGRMLALLGSVDDLDNSIVGVGGSAAEALQRFDETFNLGVPADMLEWAKRREAAVEAGQTPEPFPPKNDKSKTVDDRRTEPTEGPVNPKTKRPRNRKKT